MILEDALHPENKEIILDVGESNIVIMLSHL